jgi:phosphoglycerate dehydrogenase-like enzyme
MATKLLTAGMRANMLEALKAQLPAELDLIEVKPDMPEAARVALARQADLFFGSLPGITPGLLQAMADYRLVQITSAGYESLDLELVKRHRIPVATNGGANADGVAEHAIMLMLACLKFLPRHHQLVASGGWTSLHVEDPGELDGKTVGLFGLGFTGRGVARRLKGWGAELIYHDIARQPEAAEQDHGIRFDSCAELLARSDILSIHAPRTPATLNRFDAAAFAAMKPGALLVNTARGGIVDEAALHDAIRSGHIAAAGLDVLAVEPCASSPLFGLKEVVFTPHTAGNTTEVWRKTAAIGIRNLLRVLRGERPDYLIPEIRNVV